MKINLKNIYETNINIYFDIFLYNLNEDTSTYFLSMYETMGHLRK
jgi:hypothetical protein